MKKKSFVLLVTILMMCSFSLSACGKVEVDEGNTKVSIDKNGVYVKDGESEVEINSKGVHVRDNVDEVHVNYSGFAEHIENLIDEIDNALDNVDSHVSIIINGEKNH